MIFGNNNYLSTDLPHFGGLNAEPRMNDVGEKLLTPNWSTKTNKTNTYLIELVVQKAKLLSVSVLLLNSTVTFEIVSTESGFDAGHHRHDYGGSRNTLRLHASQVPGSE